MITITISLIASFAFGANRPSDLDPNLLAPFVRKLIKKYSKPNKFEQRLEPVGTEDDVMFASTTDLKALSNPINLKEIK